MLLQNLEVVSSPGVSSNSQALMINMLRRKWPVLFPKALIKATADFDGSWQFQIPKLRLMLLQNLKVVSSELGSFDSQSFDQYYCRVYGSWQFQIPKCQSVLLQSVFVLLFVYLFFNVIKCKNNASSYGIIIVFCLRYCDSFAAYSE